MVLEAISFAATLPQLPLPTMVTLFMMLLIVVPDFKHKL